MDNETQTTEQQASAQTSNQTGQATGQQADEKKFTQAELDSILKQRLGDEKAKREKAEAEAKAKAEAEALAKNSEWEKLAKQREADLAEANAKLAEANAKLAEHKLTEQKRAIAAEMGIPEALVLRIQGKDADEMREDAKAILAALPKPQPKTPGIVSNPGTNAQQTETYAQKRERLLGGTPQIWTGGGINYPKE